LPKRDTDPEPNSDTYGYAQHNTYTNTVRDANSQSDCHAKRYTEAISNTQDSSDTKAASYSTGLRTQPSCSIDPESIRM